MTTSPQFAQGAGSHPSGSRKGQQGAKLWCPRQPRFALMHGHLRCECSRHKPAQHSRPTAHRGLRRNASRRGWR